MEKQKIFVIDDDENINRLIATVLERNGFQPRPFTRAPAALKALETETADLILLDVMMPEMDGFQFLAELKKNKTIAAIPVIMLTARGQTTDIMKAKDLGLKDYLVKPFVPADLIAAVRETLKEK